jgi:hypothetical protein
MFNLDKILVVDVFVVGIMAKVSYL